MIATWVMWELDQQVVARKEGVFTGAVHIKMPDDTLTQTSFLAQI